jgi:6-phosphogluconate dehydrogenase
MADVKMEFGVVGLGRMGGNLALQAMEKGMHIVGTDKAQPSDEQKKAGLTYVTDYSGFKKELAAPRAVFIYVAAGPILDKIADDLAEHLEPGDIIVDGGNSYWGDTIRRAKKYKQKGIFFVDCGTSGGVTGARHGACFMVGGEREAVARIEPMLLKLCVPNGYVHAGPPGAGHFTKLVHNGIEFGMLQAIGEGMDLLEHYRDKLAIENILSCWRNGSVIRSWLIDLMHKAYTEEGGLEKIPGYVEDTGEVNWLVNDALHMEVAIPNIAVSVMELISSRDNKKNWARAVAMMRHGFGNHPYGENKDIQKIRKVSRVGDFYKDE